MRLRKFFSCCIALLLCLAISAPAFSAPLTKVRTAWMDEFEAKKVGIRKPGWILKSCISRPGWRF